MFRSLELDFSRYSVTHMGHGYTSHTRHCPCGGSDWHGGGGPHYHDTIPLPDRYGAGAVSYDGNITLDMKRMASHVQYRLWAIWKRGKVTGIGLRVSTFRDNPEIRGYHQYLDTILHLGDTA